MFSSKSYFNIVRKETSAKDALTVTTWYLIFFSYSAMLLIGNKYYPNTGTT